MEFKDAIKEIDGMRLLAGMLELRSGPGKRSLPELPFLLSPEKIERELERTADFVTVLSEARLRGAVENIRVRLGQIKDITHVIARVEEGCAAGDVDLFEIKSFCVNTASLSRIMADAGISVVPLPDPDSVTAILDPDGTGIAHFYIYDSYSPELAEIRRQIKKLSVEDQESETAAVLYEKNRSEEQKVRIRLSAGILPHTPLLKEAVQKVALLDLTLAKAELALREGFCRPELTDGDTEYTGIFNPGIRQTLEKSGRRYQPVDVAVGRGVCLITGANMGGKTLLLRNLAISQALFQFGFFVPARRALIAPVDSILTCIGDSSDQSKGLSSFAAEVTCLDNIIRRLRGGTDSLVLIDEPARTTNPAEGKAIVSALAELLDGFPSRTLITTHYSGIKGCRRRLRVKGFQDTGISRPEPGTIQDHMDYSLVPDSSDEAPREALRIARILEADEQLLERAEYYINLKDDK